MMDFNLLPGADWLVPVLSAGPAALLLAVTLYAGRNTRRRLALVNAQVDESASRLAAAELLLAEATARISQLQDGLEQTTHRQEAVNTSTARNSLRQAIALSRHGASARELIDACGLSHGEAHLISTLYGRPDGADHGGMH